MSWSIFVLDILCVFGHQAGCLIYIKIKVEKNDENKMIQTEIILK